MLFFNKLLPVLLLPTGIIAVLILVALWRRTRWPLVVALAVLYLSSIPFVGYRMLGWVESRHPAVTVAQVAPADAVVVLGGILGPWVSEGKVPNFLDSSERFEAGLVLLQEGKVRTLVFTGAQMSWRNAVATEGDALKAIAVARGVPADRIIVTREVQNTSDEARATAELIERNGWKRVILVTTGWHMARAARQFDQAGVDHIAFPVDFRFGEGREVTAIDFVPRGEAWQQTETALRESYGNLTYGILRHWSSFRSSKK